MIALKHLIFGIAYEATHKMGFKEEKKKLEHFYEQLKGASKHLFDTFLDVREFTCPFWFKDAPLYSDVGKTKTFPGNAKLASLWESANDSRKNAKNGFLPAVYEALKGKGYKRADCTPSIPSGQQYYEFLNHLNILALSIETLRKRQNTNGQCPSLCILFLARSQTKSLRYSILR